jgi:hypothetical protein
MKPGDTLTVKKTGVAIKATDYDEQARFGDCEKRWLGLGDKVKFIGDLPSREDLIIVSIGGIGFVMNREAFGK